MATALKQVDLDVEETGPDGEHRVTATVKRQALLAGVEPLQAHGALSQSITAEDVAKHPAFYANAVSLLLTTYAVQTLYAARPGLGLTRWKVLLISPGDEAGHGAREMYAFTFGRARYEAVAWNRLPFTELPNVADQFSYNLRFTLEMSRELGGSIDDD